MPYATRIFERILRLSTRAAGSAVVDGSKLTMSLTENEP